MNTSFFRYLVQFIFKAGSRQRLLFLALAGLFLSSMALIVLQSAMGGLQTKVIGRSKTAMGSGTILLESMEETQVLKILKALRHKFPDNIILPEYEIELLLGKGKFLTPVVAHGIDPKGIRPPLLKDLQFNEVVLTRTIRENLSLWQDQIPIRLISPGHVDSLFEDIPRVIGLKVDDFALSHVKEVDQFHIWVALTKIQNLIRKRDLNRIRFFGDLDRDEVLVSMKELNIPGELVMWEDINQSLVWALGLESHVMIFLFTAMTCLVSLCITSGLFIFFSKIKKDLTSFWILGMGKEEIGRHTSRLVLLLSFAAIVLGLFSGIGLLAFLELTGINIMSSRFVDRNVGLHLTASNLAISFFVPLAISWIFSALSLKIFKKETNYLDYVRSVGQ